MAGHSLQGQSRSSELARESINWATTAGGAAILRSCTLRTMEDKIPEGAGSGYVFREGAEPCVVFVQESIVPSAMARRLGIADPATIEP